MKGNICTIKALLIIQPWGHKFSRGGQACITVCETWWAPQGLESQASAPQRQRGLRTSFSYLPKMRRNLPAGCSSTELIVGGCCKLCSMLQISNSNTVLLLESWDADSVCVCKFTYVCMYVCVPMCTSVWVYICHLCMPMCIHVYLFVCLCASVCMPIYVHAFICCKWVHDHFYLCVYLCVYVRLYLCLCVSLYYYVCA